MGPRSGRGSGRRPAGGARSAVAGLALGLALGGCDGAPDASVGRGDIRDAVARGQLASPRAATLALVSLNGAPDAVQARFRQAFTGEAVTRGISVTDAPSARYLVRGYLSAYPGDRGDTIAYVFDLFDARGKTRIRRVDDAVELPAASDDPWAGVGDEVMTALAGRSADDLAAALAGTPEAQAGRVASAGAPPAR